MVGHPVPAAEVGEGSLRRIAYPQAPGEKLSTMDAP